MLQPDTTILAYFKKNVNSVLAILLFCRLAVFWQVSRKLIFVFLCFCVFVFLYAPVAIGDTIDDLKNEINEQQTEIEELERQAKEYQSTIIQKGEIAQTLKEAVGALNGQINVLEWSIRITQQKIEKTALSIEGLELEITQRTEEIKNNKKNMAGILRTIYETESEGAVELVLKYDNFSDFLNQANYISDLQKGLQEKLDKLDDLKIRLEFEKNSLEVEKENSVTYRSNLGTQQNILTGQRTEKNNLLFTTKNEEKKYQKLLTETEEKMRAMQQEIFDLEDELRFTVDPSTIPTPRSGLLAWPTEGIISQYYGCIEDSFARRIYPTCNNGKGGLHNGLDIASGFGTKIIAAQGGKVIASGSAPYAYGNWIAVEHDNGLVTLYTHMSVKKVGIGDVVERKKTVIGYMGSSGLSTGSHLHFTVYAPGTFRTKPSAISGILPIGYTLNPLDYL